MCGAPSPTPSTARAWCKALLKGNGAPAVAINPPEMWTGVMSPEEVKALYGTLDPYTFDIEKAKAELAQSSVPNGFDVTVPAPNGVPYMVPILLSVSENLKQLGITLNVQQMDDSQWLSTYFAHDKLGMQIMSYFPDFADAANYPYLFFAHRQCRQGRHERLELQQPEDG